MKIKYNPALELNNAMLQYACWDNIRETGYTYSRELENWYHRTRDRLPGILENDLSFLIRDFLGLSFLCVETVIRDGIGTVPLLLDRMRTISADSLPEIIYRGYNLDTPLSQVRNDPQRIVTLLQKAGGTIRKKEPELFLDFIRHPETFRTRLVNLMEEFYHLALEEDEERICLLMEKQILEDQQILKEDPNRFFTGFCRCTLPEKTEYPEIFISFYNEIDIIQLEEPYSLIYGRYRNRLEKGMSIPIEEIYHLLVDESRRTILQLLCRRSWFIRELATELNITSATVSYHMSKLGSMNLVTYERGEKNRVYYRADLGKVEEIIESVRRNILG